MTANSITYCEFEPDVRLRDYIRSYWYFRIHTHSPKFFDILPDGYFDLLIFIKENRIIDTRLTGIWSKSVSVSFSENTQILGIRFKPLSIGGLFKFNLKEYVDSSQSIILKDLGFCPQRLLDTFKEFPRFTINYLNTRFLRRIQTGRTDQRLQKCFELIDGYSGNITVDSISKTIGLSTRQLHRITTNMMGLGVKDYAKIVRFKNSLRDIKQNRSDYFHYYDQSHFIREIKQFTGLTPEKLNLKNNVRFLQYYDF